MVQLYIANEDGTVMWQPVTEEGVEWSTKRKSSPSTLTCKVLKDNALQFSEGCAIQLKEDGTNIFFGWIFSHSSSESSDFVTIKAYDQLRYLKNKDTYVYEGKKASELIQMIASDFQLQCGDLEDTGYVIPSRVEDNTALFDIIENALDLTLTNTKNLFILYDDFGKITLKSLGNMKVGANNQYLLIDASTAQSYTYSSSIDDNTYNKIKVVNSNKNTGVREVYITQSGENINKWGILQFYDTLKNGENGQTKADALLSLYNEKTKKLQISNALGDNRVRAGSLVAVQLTLDDMTINNFMLVEECKHTWRNGEHWMDLKLRGGEING